MKSIEKSVVIAMDGSDIELFPFLPEALKNTEKKTAPARSKTKVQRRSPN